MKKYPKTISIIIIIATMVTLLTGCGEIQKAEAAVNNTFVALKKLDFETASNYISVDEIMGSEADTGLSIDTNLFAENIFNRLEHEIILSEKIDNNIVTVKTKITAVDMKPVLGEYFIMALQYAFSSAFADPQPTEEEIDAKMEEMFVECISKEDLAKITNEVDIRVVKVDNKWKIESTDQLVSAVLGGLAEAAEELSNSFNSAE